MIPQEDGLGCWDGIYSTFDETIYTCEGNEVDKLLTDIDFQYSMTDIEKNRLSVDCETFGYPVIRVDMTGTENGGGSGPSNSGMIQFSVSPSLKHSEFNG